MLASSPARPRVSAPSTATLKVLYQLAYISSGTVLGVGALCAEERRRRTQIVQRIADNARRIRQSPRYSRGAHVMAAVSDAADYGAGDWAESGETLQSRPGYKGPSLPSVVEKEYGEMARATKTRRKPSRGVADQRSHRSNDTKLTPPVLEGNLDCGRGFPAAARSRSMSSPAVWRSLSLLGRDREHSPHFHPSRKRTDRSDARSLKEGIMNRQPNPLAAIFHQSRTPPDDSSRVQTGHDTHPFVRSSEHKVRLAAPGRFSSAQAQGRQPIPRPGNTRTGTLTAPHADLQQLSSNQFVASASMLKNEWYINRQIDQSRRSYEAMLASMDGDSQSLVIRKVHFAMFEIYLAAGEQKLAMQLLAQLKSKGKHSTVSISLLLAFAIGKEWESFKTAISVLSRDKSLVTWTGKSVKVFNHVLHVFAGSHSAKETSDFALHAIRQLDFVPNMGSLSVLLSSFVSKQDFALTSYWLRMRRQFQSRIDLSSGDLAVTLLKRWYLDFRHSHVMVMWYCRTLLQQATTLNSERFIELAKEAIASDLRRLAGMNAPWLGPIIRKRANMLEQSSGAIPHPGYIYNQQLHIVHEEQRATAESEQIARPVEARGELHSPHGLQSSISSLDHVTQQRREDVDFDNLAGALYKGNADDQRSASNSASMQSLDSVDASDVDHTLHTEFSQLRPAYSRREEQSRREMTLALSLSQYEKVLDLYEACRDPLGRPVSPIVLEIAVEASIRHHGDREHAESLLASARDAGMNSNISIGPLLIDQIRTMTGMTWEDAKKIRGMVLDYYTQNDSAATPVKPHLGTQAAQSLINAGYANYGIKLLSYIYSRNVPEVREPNLAVMSVWLLGYAKLKDVPGMQWVVNMVLERNIRIEMSFLRALSRAKHPKVYCLDGSVVYSRQSLAVTGKIQQWRDLCSERRAKQMQESKIFGRKLINLVAKAANEDHIVLNADLDDGTVKQHDLSHLKGSSLVRVLYSSDARSTGRLRRRASGGGRLRRVPGVV